MKKNMVITLATLVLLSFSCSETMVEDYIAGSWELKSYLRNNVDETTRIFIADYTETYAKEGKFTRNYVDGKQTMVRDTGVYEINEELRNIHISGVSSIADFSDSHSTLSASILDIIAIDDSEFVYSFENGGDTHEFRFIRIE